MNTMIDTLKVIPWNKLAAREKEVLLQRPVFNKAGLTESVAAIIRRVRDGGDAALAELTEELDRVPARSLMPSRKEIKAATGSLKKKLRRAIDDASGRIEKFHEADMPVTSTVETAPGLVCESRYQPLSPVGLYIPGGTAPLISTVMMLAIPARLAACEEIVMCTPPGKDGRIAPEILAAAQLCGVTKMFCAGGAQAIAAMAFGTESIPKCSKIFGPGNSWVTEAKQLVSMDPEGAAIDMPAGPSEVLVIADSKANARCIAWDLLSQAEHGPDSQVVLLTSSEILAASVIKFLAQFAAESPRAAILEQSLGAARIIKVNSLRTALEISNNYAPEHLILNTKNATKLIDQVRNAGSVFVGRWTPESLGDYCSGTNHVLPTYGWARSYGALGVGDFMRRMTFQQASRKALAKVGPTAERLAKFEGLEAHRMAVRARLRSGRSKK